MSSRKMAVYRTTVPSRKRGICMMPSGSMDNS
eukprot:CAMPEP_0194545042 /NCGR_PEP_ID=MMETSP0253-20130528/88542_1 /TAXON_ID=2966 /ORGANISM="Noctiluca scintillans" /LENGTH=31 /DNA_ID= /DNA_START= /DNA_END= /DNA_ORIENTATION=